MLFSVASAILAMVSTVLTGYLPIAVSPESIIALVPSYTALATSEISARVGRGGRNHRFEHFGRGDYALAEHAAFGNYLLLRGGEFFKRNFNAHIAPAYHYAVAFAANLFDIVYAGLIFYLGDEFAFKVAVLREKVFNVYKILRYGNERAGYKVHVVFYAEKQIFFILVGKVCLPQNLAGKTHAFSVAYFAADNGGAFYVLSVNLVNDERRKPVI